MSVDSPTSGGDDPSGAVGCSLCGHRLGEDCRFVSCYPATEGATPAQTDDDGVLAVCGDCVAEVDELVDAWSGHGAPPVDGDRSIGAGYPRVAEDCSFCDRALDGDDVLGVEYFDRDAAYGDDDGSPANFSLCEGCVPVFEEFLDNVGAE